MSDMAPIFYNAWVTLMGDPQTQETWRVDKAWKEELRKKIGDITIEAKVYKLLRIVLQQRKESMFHNCLDALLRRLKTGSRCEKCFDYFIRKWVPKKDQWAYCYRRGLQIKTNMYAEEFHHVFKRNYLKGKVNKRVDARFGR